MIKRELAMLRYLRTCLGILLLVTTTPAIRPQATADFSGQWKQENERCRPKRNGDVTLRIERHDPQLVVETSMTRGTAQPRHAIQRYTTDGKVSTSTGADGDQFDTSVVIKDKSLVFSIEEQEDSRILPSTETWSVIEDGTTLERTRERPTGEKQVYFYHREQPSSH